MGLVGEGHVGVIALDGVGKLLLHGELAFLHGGEVEAHHQVGGAGAVFHVEHLEGVVGEVQEGIAVKVFVYPLVVPGRAVWEDASAAVRSFCLLEAHLDGIVVGVYMRTGYFSGGKVDRAGLSGMDPAQIQQQDAVDEDPQVVVAGELVEHGVAVLQPAEGLIESAFHGHAEKVVDRFLTRVNTGSRLVDGITVVGIF